MPFYGGIPVAAYSPVTDIKASVVFDLTGDVVATLLTPDSARKGYMIQNTGASTVTVLFGVADPSDTVAPYTYKEAYQFTFNPGEFYLFDVPEILPYQGLSPATAGQLTIKEFI